MAISTNIRKNATVSSISVDLAQRYANIMDGLLKTYFPALNSAPDALYIMMATMGLESGFRIYHNGGTTPNHVTIGTATGIGRSYWYDPVVVPLKSSDDPDVIANITEGLSAKALMATMGMYQVRNCRESNAMVRGIYRDIAESFDLMVDPGESISDTYTNDDTGARKSMIMGCIVMETKYLSRLQKNTSDVAIRLAIGDYLGKAGTKDVLGTSPEMRLANVTDTSTNISRTLVAAKILQSNSGQVYTNPPQGSGGQSETKTTTVASTNNVRINTNGCNRA